MNSSDWHHYLTTKNFCHKFERGGISLTGIFKKQERLYSSYNRTSGNTWATVWSDMLMLAKQTIDESTIND